MKKLILCVATSCIFTASIIHSAKIPDFSQQTQALCMAASSTPSPADRLCIPYEIEIPEQLRHELASTQPSGVKLNECAIKALLCNKEKLANNTAAGTELDAHEILSIVLKNPYLLTEANVLPGKNLLTLLLQTNRIKTMFACLALKKPMHFSPTVLCKTNNRGQSAPHNFVTTVIFHAQPEYASKHEIKDYKPNLIALLRILFQEKKYLFNDENNRQEYYKLNSHKNAQPNLASLLTNTLKEVLDLPQQSFKVQQRYEQEHSLVVPQFTQEEYRKIADLKSLINEFTNKQQLAQLFDLLDSDQNLLSEHMPDRRTFAALCIHSRRPALLTEIIKRYPQAINLTDPIESLSQKIGIIPSIMKFTLNVETKNYNDWLALLQHLHECHNTLFTDADKVFAREHNIPLETNEYAHTAQTQAPAPQTSPARLCPSLVKNNQLPEALSLQPALNTPKTPSFFCHDPYKPKFEPKENQEDSI